MRLAAISGALLYVLMWTVVLPPENNPVLDDHILGAITLVALAALNAGVIYYGSAPQDPAELDRRGAPGVRVVGTKGGEGADR